MEGHEGHMMPGHDMSDMSGHEGHTMPGHDMPPSHDMPASCAMNVKLYVSSDYEHNNWKFLSQIDAF